jgi:pimeloyl-ACP methyl ester carboxylesterase
MRCAAVVVWIGMGLLGGRHAAAGTDAGTLPLHECRLAHPLKVSSLAARCGELRVAEDPQRPAGAAIQLKIAVIPALNRRSEGAPLFLLAGGPGQGAAAMYTAVAGAFARINRDHDIVLVDQRGTGGSNPLTCDYPEDWQQPDDPLPMLRQTTAACLERLGARVRYYTSSIAVQDLDAARAALGYERIDLYGASYGTRMAQLYMRRYPSRTHAVILDGVTYPEQLIGLDTPQDGERALQLIIRRCRQAPDCAKAFPTLQQDLDHLRRRFGPDKVMISLMDPSSGIAKPFEFNRGVLNSALRFLSYGAASAALLPALIHEAAQGTLAPLAAQTVMSTRQISDQLASGMQYSVVCSEDVPFFTDADIDRTALAATYQGPDQLDALREICKLWPRGAVDADLHAPLRSDIPTLLLSGEADPVTPPADAERAAAGLTHHRLLVLPGEGHGQLGTACVPRLMAEFLDSPQAARFDASCLAAHRAEPFFVSTTGPAP